MLKITKYLYLNLFRTHSLINTVNYNECISRHLWCMGARRYSSASSHIVLDWVLNHQLGSDSGRNQLCFHFQCKFFFFAIFIYLFIYPSRLVTASDKSLTVNTSCGLIISLDLILMKAITHFTASQLKHLCCEHKIQKETKSTN